MSQEDAAVASGVLLEELSSWPEEKCRRELPSAPNTTSPVKTAQSELGSSTPTIKKIHFKSNSRVCEQRILKIIVDMFLPHMNHLTLEETLFSQVLPKTIKLFDGMICELTNEAKELSSQNLEIQVTIRNILEVSECIGKTMELVTMVQIVGGLAGCVHHVCATQESVFLGNIHSLPTFILHIIKSTFVHCKNSESVYSGRLHLVSDLLQILFKEAYSLQKQLMELLDMVCPGPSVEENNISTMVEDLFIHYWISALLSPAWTKHFMPILGSLLLNLADCLTNEVQLIFYKDRNLASNFKVQSLKHHSVLKNQLKHKEIISSLCEDILFSFHSCLQLAEQMTQTAAQDNADCRLFQKTLKLCRFLANSLLHYTKEFLPFLSDSCCTLHQLYLQIYRNISEEEKQNQTDNDRWKESAETQKELIEGHGILEDPFLVHLHLLLEQITETMLVNRDKLPPSLYAARISKAQQEEIAGTFLVVLDSLISQLLKSQPFAQAVLASKLDMPCELQLPQVLLLVVVLDKLPSQPEDVQALWCTEDVTRMSILKAIFYNFGQCSAELSLPTHLQGVKGKGQTEVPVTLYQHVCVHLCAFVASFHPSLFPELDAALLNAVLSSDMSTSLLAMDAWCFLARYGTAELGAHHVTLVAHLIKSCPGKCVQLTNLSILLKRLFFFMAPPHQMEFIQNFSPKEADNLHLWQYISVQALSADLRKQVACEVVRVCTAQCRKWLSSTHTLTELDSLNTALSVLLTVCSSAGEALDSRQLTTVTEVVVQLWAFMNIEQIISQPYVQQAFSLLLQLLAVFIQNVDLQLISQVVNVLTSVIKLDPPDNVSYAVLDFISSLGKLYMSQTIRDKVLPNMSCILASLVVSKNWLLEQHTLEAFTQFAEGTKHEEVVPQCLGSEEIKNKVVSFLEKTESVDETEAVTVDNVKQEKGTFWKPVAKPCTKRARQELPFEEEYRSIFQAAARALETTEFLLKHSNVPAWLLPELEALQERIETLKCCVLRG
ncbi:hypothetical protein APTSU1_000085400 [Apodemus speciosus]|uniref:Uncharacterized protein n=1 Tax=Apodemus speciosus TaxID=105296 RepID=A0ABQ0EFB3_APOSI